MSIEFHCKHCGKKMQAADSAGGRWGKCPSCHNKIYVPSTGPDEDEELKLAPVDESDLKRQKQLMDEKYELVQQLLDEKEVPDESAGAAGPAAAEIDDKQLTIKIITYLRQMADGNLEQAEKIADSITSHGRRAVKILDEIAISQMPEPELADIPQRILSGLIKTLRARIGPSTSSG